MRVKPEHDFKPGIGDQCNECGMSLAYHLNENNEVVFVDTPEKRLATVLSWLYTMDGTYPNKNEWRMELVKKLYYLADLKGEE